MSRIIFPGCYGSISPSIPSPIRIAVTNSVPNTHASAVFTREFARIRRPLLSRQRPISIRGSQVRSIAC